MLNPYEVIFQKLEAIQADLAALKEERQAEPNPAKDDLLSEEQLCELTGRTRPTLIKYRKNGMPYIRIGSRLYYQRADVMQWLKDQTTILKNKGRDHE